MHTRFRLAGWPETSAISMKVELDSTVQVFVIEAETTASVEAVACFIVAERVEFKRDAVSHLER
jgi:hypothetical protein